MDEGQLEQEKSRRIWGSWGLWKKWLALAAQRRPTIYENTASDVLLSRTHRRLDYFADQFAAKDDEMVEDTDEDEHFPDEVKEDETYLPPKEDSEDGDEEDEEEKAEQEAKDNDDDDDDDEGQHESMRLSAQLAAKTQAQYMELTISERYTFDQTQLHFLILLSIDPRIVWTGIDVKNNLHSAVIERGIRCLLAGRMGHENTALKISPHIKYDLLARTFDEYAPRIAKRQIQALEAMFKNCLVIVPK